MDRNAFLDAIRDKPDDDATRLVFADWLDDHGEVCAAARQRWWRRMRVRLREGIQMEGTADLHAVGAALSGADDWRWRLGALAAIRVVEAYYTPYLNPGRWPESWSSERFMSVLRNSRFTLEAVALAALPQHDLAVASRLSAEACDAERGMVAACPSAAGADLRPWVTACEVLHMSERSLALTREWLVWEEEMRSEGGVAGELMQATAGAFEILIAEPLPARG